MENKDMKNLDELFDGNQEQELQEWAARLRAEVYHMEEWIERRLSERRDRINETRREIMDTINAIHGVTYKLTNMFRDNDDEEEEDGYSDYEKFKLTRALEEIRK